MDDVWKNFILIHNKKRNCFLALCWLNREVSARVKIFLAIVTKYWINQNMKLYTSMEAFVDRLWKYLLNQYLEISHYQESTYYMASNLRSHRSTMENNMHTEALIVVHSIVANINWIVYVNQSHSLIDFYHVRSKWGFVLGTRANHKCISAPRERTMRQNLSDPSLSKRNTSFLLLNLL